MNLNNPDQFYSEFFLKFMDKKKSKLLNENGSTINDMKKMKLWLFKNLMIIIIEEKNLKI